MATARRGWWSSCEGRLGVICEQMSECGRARCEQVPECGRAGWKEVSECAGTGMARWVAAVGNWDSCQGVWRNGVVGNCECGYRSAMCG